MTERDKPTGDDEHGVEPTAADVPATDSAETTEPAEPNPPLVPLTKRKRRAAAADSDAPADIPDDLREPAGADLVASDASLAWPGEDDDAATDAPTKSYAPKRSAIIAVSVLGAIMLALTAVGFAQDASDIRATAIPGQMTNLAAFLDQEKVQEFSDSEITSLGEAWADAPTIDSPTAQQASSFITAQYPDKAVTATEITAALKKQDAEISVLKLPTEESISSAIRTQSLILLGVGLAAAASAFFYARRQKWARILGMSISGLVVVMWLMQLLNGALNLPVIAIVISGAASFWFLLRGRLSAPAGAQGMGFGALFRPRPPRK